MKGKGFTLIEVLIVIAITVILAAVITPVFLNARAKAFQTSCLSNVKDVSRAFIVYRADHADSFTNMDESGGIEVPLITECGAPPECFACPGDKKDLGADNSFPYGGETYRSSYGWNMSLVNILESGLPSAKTVLLVEANRARLDKSPLYESSSELAVRHQGTLNIAFWDGHVKSVYKVDLGMMQEEGELPWDPRSWSGGKNHLPKEPGRYLMEVDKTGKASIEKLE